MYGTVHARELAEKGSDALVSYRSALERNGAEVVLLSPDQTGRGRRPLVDGLDGLLIPGGDDMDPALYGEKPDPLLEGFDTDFDRFELEVVRQARDRKLPVLGICRGHQLFNVHRGGALYQDIPARHPAGGKVVHRLKKDGAYVPAYHQIRLRKGSLLRRLLGRARLKVNSFHHQSVRTLGRGVIAAAESEDGVVEASELSARGQAGAEGFYLGLQFHPEKALDGSPEMNVIFKAFVAAARGRAAER